MATAVRQPSSLRTDRQRRRTLRTEKITSRRSTEKKAPADAIETGMSESANPTDMFEGSDESEQSTEGQTQSSSVPQAKKYNPFPDDVGEQPGTDQQPTGAEQPEQKDEQQASIGDRVQQLRDARNMAKTVQQTEQGVQAVEEVAQAGRMAAQIAKTGEAVAATGEAASGFIAFLVATSEVWVPVLVILIVVGLVVLGIVILAAMACSGQSGTILDVLPAEVKKAIVDLATGLVCPK